MKLKVTCINIINLIHLSKLYTIYIEILPANNIIHGVYLELQYQMVDIALYKWLRRYLSIALI